MHSYPGIAPLTVSGSTGSPGNLPATLLPFTGFWTTAQVADGGDPRSAANLFVAVEAAIDRSNFIAWRMPDWIEGGDYRTAFTGIVQLANAITVDRTGVIDSHTTLTVKGPGGGGDAISAFGSGPGVAGRFESGTGAAAMVASGLASSNQGAIVATADGTAAAVTANAGAGAGSFGLKANAGAGAGSSAIKAVATTAGTFAIEVSGPLAMFDYNSVTLKRELDPTIVFTARTGTQTVDVTIADVLTFISAPTLTGDTVWNFATPAISNVGSIDIIVDGTGFAFYTNFGGNTLTINGKEFGVSTGVAYYRFRWSPNLAVWLGYDF